MKVAAGKVQWCHCDLFKSPTAFAAAWPAQKATSATTVLEATEAAVATAVLAVIIKLHKRIQKFSNKFPFFRR